MAPADQALLRDVLRAVIERPEDDTPRLVYADALQQAGDPRGELIALQCALAAGTAGPEAAERVEHLLAEHRARWTAELGEDVELAHFERGFASAVKVRCTAGVLELLDRAPIEHLVLVHEEEDEDVDRVALARRLARDPRMARLRGLDLSWTGWGEEAFAALLGADLRALRSLSIGDLDCQTYAAHAIATSPALDALESLALCGDYHADFGAGLAVLAGSPRLARLARLELANCGLGPEDVAPLAASPYASALRELELSGGSYEANRIRDEGVELLARSRSLSRLERLGVAHNEVGNPAFRALGSADALPALRALVASGSTYLTGLGVAMLAGAPRFARLAELALGGSPVGIAGAEMIAGSPHATGLRFLNLHGCSIREEGAAALAASPYLDGLERLVVERELHAILEPRFGARLAP